MDPGMSKKSKNEKKGKKKISIDDVEFMHIVVRLPKNTASISCETVAIVDGDEIALIGEFGVDDVAEMKGEFDDWSKDTEYAGEAGMIPLDVPKGVVAVKISATVYDGVEKTVKEASYGPDDIAHGRAVFLDVFEDDDYDAVYTLTELGRQMLEAGRV